MNDVVVHRIKRSNELTTKTRMKKSVIETNSLSAIKSNNPPNELEVPVLLAM